MPGPHDRSSDAKDPFAVLSLDPGASASDVRFARRRLAKALHPDRLVGVDETERRAAAGRLAAVNRSADLALAAVAARVAQQGEQGAAPTRSPSTSTSPSGSAPSGSRTASAGEGEGDVETGDAAVSFSVDALPVEAFELLFLALSSIGDPKVVDEPYLLEGIVDDPSLGVCRIELVPEAGGSIVTVEVGPMGRAVQPPPSARAVAGRLLAEMEAFGPR